LEKERQRASESRQEYLAIKEETATQEGRAKQLEDEMRELRAKHKKELQEVATHRELLEKVFIFNFFFYMAVSCITFQVLYCTVPFKYLRRQMIFFFLSIIYMVPLTVSQYFGV
jgi:hypothetical protein